MWPFRRNKADTNVPEEVKEYYEAEKRERVGLAWVLGVVTLAATVLVVLGLFFGGRWAYRKIAHKNKPTTTVQQPKKTPEVSTNNSSSNKSDSGSSAQGSSQPSQSSGTTHEDHASTSNTSSSETPSSSSASIPNTGPEGTLAAFAIASILGFSFNELRLRRKLSR